MTIDEVKNKIEKSKEKYFKLLHKEKQDEKTRLKRLQLATEIGFWIEEKHRIEEAMYRGETGLAHGDSDDGRKKANGMGTV